MSSKPRYNVLMKLIKSDTHQPYFEHFDELDDLNKLDNEPEQFEEDYLYLEEELNEIQSSNVSKSTRSIPGKIKFLSATSVKEEEHENGERRQPRFSSVVEIEQKCSDFLTIKNIAEDFVDNLLISGEKGKRKLLQRIAGLSSSSSSFLSTESSSSTSGKSYYRFSGWPTIGQFNEKLGALKIREMLDTWSYGEDWFFDVEFIFGRSDLVADYYLYENIWSIPTKQYPVPQATASIFFTFEVSRIKPKCCIVEVYYNFEGQDSKFTPKEQTNPENSLLNIVDAKLKFFSSLRF